MLPCFVRVLFAFYLQGVLKFNCKIPAPKRLIFLSYRVKVIGDIFTGSVGSFDLTVQICGAERRGYVLRNASLCERVLTQFDLRHPDVFLVLAKNEINCTSNNIY